MKTTAALIIIYNHRFDKNIAVLEEIYRHRFTHIYHLVPFYDGPLPNVIAVYENSYRFQGYIAQGLTHFFNEEFEHYLFVADDLMLHPAIDETNYKAHFNLEAATSFIPEVMEVHQLLNNETLHFMSYKKGGKIKWHWWRLRDLVKYKHGAEGIENETEMPGYAEAAALLKEHGYTMKPLKFIDLFGPVPTSIRTKQDRKEAFYYMARWRKYKRQYRIAYPVVASYSDIVIVSGASIKKFAQYCGVFATNGLFVEFAIPTALLLASKEVVTEPLIGKRGSIYWTYTKPEQEAFAAAMKPFENKLSRLLQNFPAGKLYIHPLKLSKWVP